jgi:hypothetical protein
MKGKFGFIFPYINKSLEIFGNALPLTKTILHLSVFAHVSVFQRVHKAMGAQPKGPALLAQLITIARIYLDEFADFLNLEADFVIADVITAMSKIEARIKLAIRTDKQLHCSRNTSPVGTNGYFGRPNVSFVKLLKNKGESMIEMREFEGGSFSQAI